MQPRKHRYSFPGVCLVRCFSFGRTPSDNAESQLLHLRVRRHKNKKQQLRGEIVVPVSTLWAKATTRLPRKMFISRKCFSLPVLYSSANACCGADTPNQTVLNSKVMQGFGVGIRLGMTMDDLRQLVGIHPTVAEEVTLLQTTKRCGVCAGGLVTASTST